MSGIFISNESYFYGMRSIFLLCILAGLFACKQKKEEQPAATAPVQTSTPKSDTSLPYYDVSSTILNEIDAIEKTPRIFIYRITELNGKRDSVVININELKQLALPFHQLQLNKPLIKQLYQESIFEDTDTKSFVLNYKTSNSFLPVKSVSVMLDNKSQEFKRLDMMRSFQQNDALVEQRLGWSSGKKFQIVQIVTKGNTEATELTYVIWQRRK